MIVESDHICLIKKMSKSRQIAPTKNRLTFLIHPLSCFYLAWIYINILLASVVELLRLNAECAQYFHQFYRVDFPVRSLRFAGLCRWSWESRLIELFWWLIRCGNASFHFLACQITIQKASFRSMNKKSQCSCLKYSYCLM